MIILSTYKMNKNIFGLLCLLLGIAYGGYSQVGPKAVDIASSKGWTALPQNYSLTAQDGITSVSVVYLEPIVYGDLLGWIAVKSPALNGGLIQVGNTIYGRKEYPAGTVFARGLDDVRFANGSNNPDLSAIVPDRAYLVEGGTNRIVEAADRFNLDTLLPVKSQGTRVFRNGAFDGTNDKLSNQRSIRPFRRGDWSSAIDTVSFSSVAVGAVSLVSITYARDGNSDNVVPGGAYTSFGATSTRLWRDELTGDIIMAIEQGDDDDFNDLVLRFNKGLSIPVDGDLAEFKSADIGAMAPFYNDLPASEKAKLWENGEELSVLNRSVIAGTKNNVNVTFKNVGRVEWTKDTHVFSLVGSNNRDSYADSFKAEAAPVVKGVKSDSVATLTVEVEAPQLADSGQVSLPMQWGVYRKYGSGSFYAVEKPSPVANLILGTKLKMEGDVIMQDLVATPGGKTNFDKAVSWKPDGWDETASVTVAGRNEYYISRIDDSKVFWGDPFRKSNGRSSQSGYDALLNWFERDQEGHSYNKTIDNIDSLSGLELYSENKEYSAGYYEMTVIRYPDSQMVSPAAIRYPIAIGVPVRVTGNGAVLVTDRSDYGTIMIKPKKVKPVGNDTGYQDADMYLYAMPGSTITVNAADKNDGVGWGNQWDIGEDASGADIWRGSGELISTADYSGRSITVRVPGGSGGLWLEAVTGNLDPIVEMNVDFELSGWKAWSEDGQAYAFLGRDGIVASLSARDRESTVTLFEVQHRTPLGGGWSESDRVTARLEGSKYKGSYEFMIGSPSENPLMPKQFLALAGDGDRSKIWAYRCRALDSAGVWSEWSDEFTIAAQIPWVRKVQIGQTKAPTGASAIWFTDSEKKDFEFIIWKGL